MPSDPRERAGCMCPRIDGNACAKVRHGRSDDVRGEDDYECPCLCHELHSEDLRDYDEPTDGPTKPETGGDR